MRLEFSNFNWKFSINGIIWWTSKSLKMYFFSNKQYWHKNLSRVFISNLFFFHAPVPLNFDTGVIWLVRLRFTLLKHFSPLLCKPLQDAQETSILRPLLLLYIEITIFYYKRSKRLLYSSFYVLNKPLWRVLSYRKKNRRNLSLILFPIFYHNLFLKIVLIRVHENGILILVRTSYLHTGQILSLVIGLVITCIVTRFKNREKQKHQKTPQKKEK